MKRCKNCVLPETFPGIAFDTNGLCNYCRDYKGHKHLSIEKEKYRKKFEKLLNQHKNQDDYDCLIAYSGGKDSTYTLYLLKHELKLKILTLTFDNGFISPMAQSNINIVIENLGVDHIQFKPRFDLLKKIFIESSKSDLYPPKSLERASSICTSCMGLVKFISLKLALEKQIPFIIYGWSPGQAPITSSIFKNNPEIIKKMQSVIEKPLHQIGGDSIKNYFLDEADFNDNKNHFPYNISPLAFLDYNKVKIYRTISKLSWKKPEDTDENSTNCTLNSYAIYIHKNRFGFHPYAFELAKLVREGYIRREDAIKELTSEVNSKTLEYVRKKLID